jgi:hypothetical protein
MVTLRCTQKLARYLTLTPDAESQESTSRLGDWYANLIYVGRRRFVLCVSERSFLSLILPGRDLRQIPSRLPGTVESLLGRLGVPPAVVAEEVAELRPVAVGYTRNRKVVGSMIELGLQARAFLERHSDHHFPGDLELALAAVPCLQLKPDPFPYRTAGALLGVDLPNPEWRTLL